MFKGNSSDSHGEVSREMTKSAAGQKDEGLVETHLGKLAYLHADLSV